MCGGAGYYKVLNTITLQLSKLGQACFQIYLVRDGRLLDGPLHSGVW